MMEEERADKTKFSIGFTDANMEMMVMFIPLRHYAEHEDGTALLRGKVEEAKGIALLKIQEIRQKKATAGLIKPMNGNVPLGVQ